MMMMMMIQLWCIRWKILQELSKDSISFNENLKAEPARGGNQINNNFFGIYLA